MTELESKLSALIVETLELADVVPTDIDVEAPLFGDGLGLDSVDALELVIAVHKQFGVHIKAEDAASKDAFASLRALASYVQQAQAQRKP